MNDTFSKACLGIIAISLAIIAYAQVSGRHLAQPATQVPSSAARDTSDRRCVLALEEARVTLAALQAQIKNVPATVPIKDPSGKETIQSPNRLYEQLMLQIVQTKTELQVLEAKCGA